MSNSEAIDTLIDLLELLRKQRNIWQSLNHVSLETREHNVAYYQRRCDAIGVALVSLGHEPVPFPEPALEPILVGS